MSSNSVKKTEDSGQKTSDKTQNSRPKTSAFEIGILPGPLNLDETDP